MPIFGWLVGIRNQAFTQVLFAWRFRLVVKLTALHLPFTHTVSNHTLSGFTMRDIASEPIHWSPSAFHPSLRFTPGNIYTPLLIPGQRSQY
jgi:hypothetical protein